MFDKRILESEENFLNAFNALPKDDSSKVFHFLSKTPDVLMLIELSLKNENVRKYCQQPEMNAFWDGLWFFYDRHPTYAETLQGTSLRYKGMRPQQNISSYDLVCGMTLYNKISQTHEQNILEDGSEELIKLLQIAGAYGSFAALQALCHIVTKKLASNQEVNPDIFRPLLFKAASWHGTPVYFLLVTTYLAYADYYRRNEKTTEGKIACHRALEYLHAAQFSEPNCQDEIHNAYHGRGIKSANPWKTDSLQTLEKVLITKYNLPKAITDEAYKAGQAIASDWKAQVRNPAVLH